MGVVRRAVAVLAFLCVGLGCAKNKGDVSEPEAAKTRLTVIARGDEDSNGGYALKVVVRAVEEPDFIEDTYSDIAALVSRPDETVLGVLTVFPGEGAQAVVLVEEVPGAIGVYGLFNETEDGEWKILVEAGESELGGVLVEVATSERSVRELE